MHAVRLAARNTSERQAVRSAASRESPKRSTVARHSDFWSAAVGSGTLGSCMRTQQFATMEQNCSANSSSAALGCQQPPLHPPASFGPEHTPPSHPADALEPELAQAVGAAPAPRSTRIAADHLHARILRRYPQRRLWDTPCATTPSPAQTQGSSSKPVQANGHRGVVDLQSTN